MHSLAQLKSKWLSLLLLATTLLLSACGGGGGGSSTSPQYAPTLYQAVYSSGYQYTKQFYITGAPDDTDWDRMGVLHDGTDYRLYFMKQGTSDTLYQFAYNPNSADFEYGYNSIPQLTLTNVPADADGNSLAMSNDGTYYYAHMKSLSVPTRIYTFRYVANTTTYAYQRSYNITKAPADTDWSRWAMLYGDSASRFYAGKTGVDSPIYQFKYNPTTQSYEWGYGGAVSTLAVIGMPSDSDTSNFSMLNNGTQYQFYYLNKRN
ncbi:MAG: hypothetical protein GC149_01850 [Gammaproteobacteria bacterium]|nr:hypothetical protein [Gammaproteobacteria bacterium]